MIEASTLIAFFFAVISIVFFKKKMSEYFVGASAIMLLLPVLGRQPAMIAITVLALILIFEMLALNSDLWRQREFRPIYQSRTRTILVGLCLTIGVTTTIWWWQNTDLRELQLDLGDSSWWKILLTLFLAFHLTTIQQKTRSRK